MEASVHGSDVSKYGTRLAMWLCPSKYWVYFIDALSIFHECVYPFLSVAVYLRLAALESSIPKS